jgi:disulfide bond formation protein DsbB
MIEMPSRQVILHLLIFLFCMIVSIVAFFFQLDYHELPCPLCILQRFGFLLIGFGAFLTISRGNSWKYDLIILFSSLFTLLVGLRQVFLHIIPGDPGYGSTFFGLHLYSLSVIASFLIMIALAMLPFINIVISQIPFEVYYSESFIKLLRLIFILVILANMVSTYLECGLTQCPDNPIVYLELQKDNT